MRRDQKRQIVLIVPCYNEARRLPVASFEKADRSLSFIFVDDGSTDDTAAVIERLKNPRAHLLRLPENGGKAAAVRQGMLYAGKDKRFAGASWIGYIDADLATPLDEIGNMITYMDAFSLSPDVIIGSRVKRMGSIIERSGLRHVLGRMLATVSSIMFRMPVYDSQCGAKLFRPKTAAAVFAETFISQWIFDIELLFRCRDYAVLEYPLFRWRDIAGSKIRVARVALRVVRDLFAIRRKYRALIDGRAAARVRPHSMR